jgi:hypothetical protein
MPRILGLALSSFPGHVCVSNALVFRPAALLSAPSPVPSKSELYNSKFKNGWRGRSEFQRFGSGQGSYVRVPIQKGPKDKITATRPTSKPPCAAVASDWSDVFAVFDWFHPTRKRKYRSPACGTPCAFHSIDISNVAMNGR